MLFMFLMCVVLSMNSSFTVFACSVCCHVFLLYSIILILCVLSFIAIVIITVLSLCSAFGE